LYRKSKHTFYVFFPQKILDKSCTENQNTFYVFFFQKSWTKVVQKIKTHILCFFPPKILDKSCTENQNTHFMFFSPKKSWTKVVQKIKTHILCFFPPKILDKSCTENQNTHFMFFFSPKNPAVYEIMWQNTVQPDRQQMTIWRMRITCWITKATDTHSEYVLSLLIASPRQRW